MLGFEEIKFKLLLEFETANLLLLISTYLKSDKNVKHDVKMKKYFAAWRWHINEDEIRK